MYTNRITLTKSAYSTRIAAVVLLGGYIGLGNSMADGAFRRIPYC